MTGGYRTALAAELLKARHSKVPLTTLIAWSATGGVAGLFMLIIVNPALAHRLGLLHEKASLSGLTADWPGLLAFLTQIIAVGDLLLFSFIATWVFGREFADGTMRYLLALPVSRTAIALAKFTVVTLWAAAGTLWLCGLAVALGYALGLPGGGTGFLAHGLITTATAAGLTLLVTTPVAWIACVGRGYLAPLASAVVALILAQVAAALGWGGIVPWSVPAVAAGLAPGTRAGLGGIASVLITAIAGVACTLRWWRSGQAGI